MKYFNKQSGSLVVLLLTIVVVIGIGATLGYMAYDRINNSSDNNSSKITDQSSVADDVNIEPTPDVVTTSDLDVALEALDQIDDSSTVSDSMLIDNQISEF